MTKTDSQAKSSDAASAAEKSHALFNPETALQLGESSQAMTERPANSTRPDYKYRNPIGRAWEDTLHTVREASPEIVVNNSSQPIFAAKLVGDILSTWSGMNPVKGNLNNNFQGLVGRSITPKQFVSSMSSPYRAAAGSITSLALGFGLFHNEKPLTKEQLDEYKSMPVGDFVNMRIKHAFDPKNHILATVGMATIANGALTLASGIHQWPGRGKVPFEAIMGSITMLAGSILQFMPDQEKAWQVSTAAFLWRIPAAGGQAYRAYAHGIPNKGIPAGDWQQPAKFGLQQFSNVWGLAYGGVEKHDGKIHYTLDEEDKIKRSGSVIDAAGLTLKDNPTPTIATPATAEQLSEELNRATGQSAAHA